MIGVYSWEPCHEQETSFRGGKTQLKSCKMCYLKKTGQTPEAFHFNDFKLRDEKLYYRDKRAPLTDKQNKLRQAGVIVEILGKEGLCELGFDIPRGKLTAQQAVVLNRIEKELPTTSDVTWTGEMELQEITKDLVKSTENLIEQLDGSENLSMCAVISLDKQLKTMRNSLKLEVAKKVELQQPIKQEKRKHSRRHQEVHRQADLQSISQARKYQST